MTRKQVTLLFHLIGWMAFIFFPIMFLTHPQEVKRMHHLGIFISGVVISNAILISFFYLNSLYLIPKYYFARKYLIFFGIALAVFFVFVIIMVTNPMFAPPPGMPPPLRGGFQPPPPPPDAHQPLWPFTLASAFRFAVVFFVSLGLKITQRLRQTEQEKLESNLQYLKAQVNPHFLFNTLNSIYSLAVVKSDQTPEAIAKLSSIMRYVTTGTNEDRVSLEKEVEYLCDYIDLQKMRMTENIAVDFQVKGNLQNKKVAPLLMIPFIENCFKYGVSTETASFIQVALEVNDHDLRFTAVNKIVRKASEHESSGTGLTNVKQRFNLIYPGKHELKITHHENVYSVELLLKLG